MSQKDHETIKTNNDTIENTLSSSGSLQLSKSKLKKIKCRQKSEEWIKNQIELKIIPEETSVTSVLLENARFDSSEQLSGARLKGLSSGIPEENVESISKSKQVDPLLRIESLENELKLQNLKFQKSEKERKKYKQKSQFMEILMNENLDEE